MAAAVYFEKLAEDEHLVTYGYGYGFGFEREDITDELVVAKGTERLVDPPARSSMMLQMAWSGIFKDYRRLERWPDRGGKVYLSPGRRNGCGTTARIRCSTISSSS
jgi:hypothetical protein